MQPHDACVRRPRWPEVSRLTFIRRARDLGMSLDDIRKLLAVSDQPDADCGEARDLLNQQLSKVEARRVELQALATSLKALAHRCDATCANQPGMTCTIFLDVTAPQAI